MPLLRAGFSQSPPGGTRPKLPSWSLKFVQPTGMVYVSAGLKLLVVCVPAGTSPRHVPPNALVHCVLTAVISCTGTAATSTLLTIASAAGRAALYSFGDGEWTVTASVCTSAPIRIEDR